MFQDVSHFTMFHDFSHFTQLSCVDPCTFTKEGAMGCTPCGIGTPTTFGE